MSAIEANVLKPTSLLSNSPLRYSDHKCSKLLRGESCFHRFLPLPAGNTTLIITIEEARSLGLRSRYSSEASNHCPHE